MKYRSFDLVLLIGFYLRMQQKLNLISLTYINCSMEKEVFSEFSMAYAKIKNKC